MSYDKNTWQTGDVITANKLNHMEDGIAGAGGGGVLALTEDEHNTLDHTWQEIADATFAVLNYEDGDGMTIVLTKAVYGENAGQYGIGFVGGSYMPDAPRFYIASSVNGYPVLAG